MADNIVASLFGLTPLQVEQQQTAQQQSFAEKMAGWDAAQRSVYGMTNAGGQLAGSIGGMLGLRNPAMEQAQITQAVMANGGDIGTSKGLLAKAEQFRQAGDLRTAALLTFKGKELEREEAKAALAERKQAFQEGEALDLKRQALQQQLEIAKQRSEDTRIAAADRVAAQREANQIKLLLGQMAASAKTAGQGKPPMGYRYTPDGDLEAIPGGPKDVSAKNKMVLDAAKDKAKIVLGKVDEALNDLGGGYTTTGLTGAAVSIVPGTSAYDLRRTIDTIKANLGFNELQAMRQASPTGGALGQVAVKELEFLQSTIASLDANQSTPKIKNSLSQVKKHYNNWLKTLEQDASANIGQEKTTNAPPANTTYSDPEKEARYQAWKARQPR